MTTNLFAGTIGMSVWFSSDMGETWARPYSESGLYLESRVWALSCHPATPDRLYAGTDRGVYVCDVPAKTWTHLPSQLDDLCIWSLVQAPSNPDVLIAGTQPAGLYRSDDGGRSWRQLPCSFAEECIYVQDPRVTQIMFDPADENHLWAAVEIDGVHFSADGGATWERRCEGLKSLDIHGLAATSSPRRRLFATTNKGLHVSEDEGQTWQYQHLDSDWQYCRVIVPSAGDDSVIYLANGNGPPGDSGRLLVSRDGGGSWAEAPLPAVLNSTPWCIATNPADPDLLFLATNLGQLFRSRDGGASWNKLARELGEVRALIWQNA
jgi:photosystem II stability/assembly factor-like uncharacterized protein